MVGASLSLLFAFFFYFLSSYDFSTHLLWSLNYLYNCGHESLLSGLQIIYSLKKKLQMLPNGWGFYEILLQRLIVVIYFIYLKWKYFAANIIYNIIIFFIEEKEILSFCESFRAKNKFCAGIFRSNRAIHISTQVFVNLLLCQQCILLYLL